ncbi:hypothetical protein GLOIN_2v1874867 [Rhizophagus irregularis DAOM 181602=DAOM 197198]|uniref:Uncharacterized protein n=1 Tax=Rhizophagus irregularis (strain DAOM 181602 / DAOM 197198 / MUCL 43194) TaxID=747089 RepID=A0A2P4Q5G7_RHIID|nr:hypothetical protein GLOIN_2v1874867 [Rhizophagus irregularis DAOM 181602=DAOM 197198]POG72895.1 hypothetical protein GLOIN_2v1874867 [Rhizophagus irregularis DAOM 181602=DAOM 197198]|eukprot:XP_025179761.1 hypothetical protein GLOIN_2v1874867 [Rhizophagus irregularis DAOM 181602=DAOM 197198]
MDVKMDNVNFGSTSSIFDNVNLHAKPMDSSTNGMDTRREHNRDRQPTTVNVSWKSNQGRIISPAFVWKCDSENRALGVRELLGDECLDLFMPVETRSPNQVSNNISIQKRNKGTMQTLQSYSELVDALKNDREFHEFHKSTDEWLIDQENKEYFKKTYDITNIHPLFVDQYGMTVLFLDDRGILFAWCEMTKDTGYLKN